MTSKICFVMTDAVSFNLLYRDQLEYLRDQADIDITLICGGSPEQLATLRARNIGQVVDLDFQRQPSVLKDGKALVRLSAYMLSHRFDVVIYITPKAMLLGSIASAMTRQKRRIAFSVGRPYENFLGIKKRVFQGFDVLSFALSHEVLFVSKSLRSVCLKEGLVNKSKARVIDQGSFSGIDVKCLAPVSLEHKKALRQKYQLPIDAFVICVVGRVCTDKGFADIGAIAQKLKEKNIHFIFAGALEDTLGESVVEAIVKDNKGVYLPTSMDVHEVFQCADLHLFLSHREGFGNVAIEAASCAIPTFAYDVVGVKDSVNDGVSGRKFALKDISAVTEAIAHAADDAHFKTRYPQARDWAMAHFERQQLWDDYLDFYLSNVDHRDQQRRANI